MGRRRAYGLGLLALVVGLAHAAPLPLANTGYAGALLPDAAIDPNYTLIVSPDSVFPGPSAFVTNDAYPIPPWSAIGPNSRWISPRADAGSENAVGNYTYRYTFSLSGFDPVTAQITGTWATDNGGFDILLNGVSISPAPTSPVSFLQPLGSYTFTVPVGSNFNACSNTLDFVLNNAGGPTGLRVELSGTAAANSPVGVAAAFAPTSIPVGAVSTLSFTLVNASGNSAQSCLGFSAALASGLSLSGAVSPAQCGGTLSAAGNILSLSNASLAPGSSSCTISVLVTSSIPGSYVETDAASISARAGNVDTTPVNASLLVTGLADLATAATIPSSAVAGAVVMVPVVFTNSGPSPATNVVASATLTGGLVGVVVSNGGSYNSATGAVTWPLVASLASGASLNYVVTYTAPAAGSIPFSATVSSATTDVDLANNAVAGTTAVSPRADVSVSAAIPAAVTAGSAVTLPITVLNNGPSVASNVAISASLPPGLAGVVVSDGGGYNIGSGAVTWPLVASLSSGASLNYTVAFTAPASGSVAFSASVSSPTSDPNSANNTTAGATVVSTSADMSVTAAVPSTVVAAATVNVSLVFSNSGPSIATNVAASATLPGGLSGVVVSNGGAYNSATGAITWPLVSSLAAGAALNYSVSYTAPTTGTVPFNASVSSATNDANIANNALSAATAVSTLADVSVTAVIPGVAIAGTTVVIPLVVTNAGPSTASNLTTSAVLPSGLTGVIVSNSGSYNAATGAVTWPVVASLTSGASLQYSVSYTVPVSGSLAFSAIVSSATSDSNAANNVVSAATPIRSTQAVVVATVSPMGLMIMMGLVLVLAMRTLGRVRRVPPRR